MCLNYQAIMAYPYSYTSSPIFDDLKALWDANKERHDRINEALSRQGDELRKVIQKETQDRIDAITWEYSIDKVSMEGWMIIRKDAINPPDNYDNSHRWSKPFKIINSVLVFSEYPYNSKSWQWKVIQQLLTDDVISSINEGIVPQFMKF